MEVVNIEFKSGSVQLKIIFCNRRIDIHHDFKNTRLEFD